MSSKYWLRRELGTLKTRDWKTRDLKSMESLTKHKCRNNVEREPKATAQKHRYQKLRSWDQDSFGRHGSRVEVERTSRQVGTTKIPPCMYVYVAMCR